MMLILASSSPRRRELLTTLGIPFTIHKPDIDETQRPAEPPLEYVSRLAREKAQAVAAQLQPDFTVIAADTVVILAADTIGITPTGEILGKPADAAEAYTMLQRLRLRPHLVCTAFALLKRTTNGDEWHTEQVQTWVYMRDYSDTEIEAYIATGDPFDKAGSYAIQHEGFHPVERIEGSYTNVVGFPLEEIQAALHKLGIGPAQ
jgi:septum formation protein